MSDEPKVDAEKEPAKSCICERAPLTDKLVQIKGVNPDCPAHGELAELDRKRRS